MTDAPFPPATCADAGAALTRLARAAATFPEHNDRDGQGWTKVRHGDLAAINAEVATLREGRDAYMAECDLRAAEITRLHADIGRLSRERDAAALDADDLAREAVKLRAALGLDARRDPLACACRSADAFKAAHDIGPPAEGYREMVWRDAADFYEKEDDGIRDLLRRWLAAADAGFWRDAARPSLAAHPVADETRAALGREAAP